MFRSLYPESACIRREWMSESLAAHIPSEKRPHFREESQGLDSKTTTVGQ